MAVYCDECGTPLSPNDESIYYGGGAYCPEHMPDDAGADCDHCECCEYCDTSYDEAFNLGAKAHKDGVDRLPELDRDAQDKLDMAPDRIAKAVITGGWYDGWDSIESE